ncbi:hypothetical protein GE061_016754 [Apolygus lucorum]|uniref:Uncharacterized protein n=1 Tax=Apolygus lucorum TaxID=248454 RepID=A0A8S9XGY2_APOLU|nr:hypothetical protein GE061_016754 [Apolygus lucorum]
MVIPHGPDEDVHSGTFGPANLDHNKYECYLSPYGNQVLSGKDDRSVYQLISADEKECITVLMTANAPNAIEIHDDDNDCDDLANPDELDNARAYEIPDYTDPLYKKTALSGTICASQKHNPPDVLQAKLKKGEIIQRWTPEGIKVTKWRDKRPVLTISSKRSGDLEETTNRRDRQHPAPLPPIPPEEKIINAAHIPALQEEKGDGQRRARKRCRICYLDGRNLLTYSYCPGVPSNEDDILDYIFRNPDPSCKEDAKSEEAVLEEDREDAVGQGQDDAGYSSGESKGNFA